MQCLMRLPGEWRVTLCMQTAGRPLLPPIDLPIKMYSHKYKYELETLQSSASERPRYMLKAAAIHYLMCVTVAKVSQGGQKAKTVFGSL